MLPVTYAPYPPHPSLSLFVIFSYSNSSSGISKILIVHYVVIMFVMVMSEVVISVVKDFVVMLVVLVL